MSELLFKTIRLIKPLDKEAMAKARARQDALTKPRGSLGELEALAIKLAGIQGKAIPEIRHKAIITMAADHGVVSEGVSLYPKEVTAQMVANFLRGGAAINVIARSIDARVIVVDIGVASKLAPHSGLISHKIAYGTQNMALGPAMSYEQAIKALETGLEIVKSEKAKGLDIVGTGDMGIGNTTASSAICAVMMEKPVALVTGHGTGVQGKQLAHKIEIIEKALAANRPNADDPIDVLAKVGGFEIGGLAGVMLGAARYRIPVVIYGFISGAAALIATVLAPELKNHLIAAHLSAEPGHRMTLRHLGLKPLFDLKMRLGEGTGAALGIMLAQISARLLGEMATFSEAGVSEREK